MNIMIQKVVCVFHYWAYYACKQKDLIKKDMLAFSGNTNLYECLIKYRNFRNIFYYRLENRLLKQICKCILKENNSIEIYGEIGGGLVLYHKMGCTINAKKIGESVKIMQGVTIGKGKITELGDRPVIGDNTWLCTNSVVIGGISIGNNCVIGAGAVVVSDIPDDSIAVGVPARIISKG